MFGITTALDSAVAALGFIAVGIALGTVSGLIPDRHNNMALLLAGIAPALPGPPRLVAAAMLAAGVVHTFLDVVPMLAIEVPDAAMAAGVLPGHRLDLQGRGHEALRLSALKSGSAVALAVPLAIPVTRLMTRLYRSSRRTSRYSCLQRLHCSYSRNPVSSRSRGRAASMRVPRSAS